MLQGPSTSNNTATTSQSAQDLSNARIVAQVPPREEQHLQNIADKITSITGPAKSTDIKPSGAGGVTLTFAATSQVAPDAQVEMNLDNPTSPTPVAGGRGVAIKDLTDGNSLVFAKDSRTGNSVVFAQQKDGSIVNYAVIEPVPGAASQVVNVVNADGSSVDGTRGVRQAGNQPVPPKDYYQELLGN